MIEHFLTDKVVIDNTVLSNFSKTNSFYLIKETLKGIPIIMLSVQREAYEDPIVKEDVMNAVDEGWLKIEKIKGRNMLRDYYMLSKSYPGTLGYKAKLGDGEAASLVYASYENCALLTDDNGPRKRAQEYNVKAVGGTLAILYFAHVEKNIINVDECNQLFTDMRNLGSYFPKKYQTYSMALPDLQEKFPINANVIEFE
ncbi:hypothetical protein [Bacillus altitudinis]|uniref:hypothetical protein n=1 Tax=Bacillus altitudinis TaxID=293387 RepID=UPI0014591F2A|nr:hypothetical protein [Bacillus altitudinis]NMF14800.1 hypothetical protein [Bacillus altitudinis]